MNTEASTHPHVLIIGGGTAGITVAARLRRAAPDLAVTLIEPATTHYYQPLWTLVGGGIVPKETTARAESSVMPAGVKWVRDYAEEFLPEQNAVVTRDGTRIAYDFLVVAPGIQLECLDDGEHVGRQAGDATELHRRTLAPDGGAARI